MSSKKNWRYTCASTGPADDLLLPPGRQLQRPASELPVELLHVERAVGEGPSDDARPDGVVEPALRAREGPPGRKARPEGGPLRPSRPYWFALSQKGSASVLAPAPKTNTSD